MKLRRATVSGFRGAPVEFELRLAEKSFCLLAENGHGKTTIVDGLEFWSSGDIRHYHREGYELDCVINVDSPEASVMCETTLHPPLTRTLAGGRVSNFEPTGPMAVDTELPLPLPILRHRTMAEFMDMSPGDKKKVLLDLVGLSSLAEFRQTLRTGTTTAGRAADEANRQLQGEIRALETLRGARDVVELAEELRREGKLARSITSETGLLEFELESVAPSTKPDRSALIADLARALEDAEDNASAAWNEAVADRDVLVARSLSTLVTAGQRVLEDWEESACPLCRQPKDRDELLVELQKRAVALREADERFAALERDLGGYSSRVSSLLSKLELVIAAAPPEGWPEEAKFAHARDQLREHVETLTVAVRERTACPPAPHVELSDLTALESAARNATEGEQAPKALATLIRLQEQVRRLRAAERRAAVAASVSTGMVTMLEITDSETRAAIEGAIGRIGKLAADFYGRLVSMPVYTDVTLEYRPERAGGIEFSLVFDGRHRVSPPQRVMSESQLNSLGLALFLARLKVDPQLWRTLVLDDVVNSFDANHRVGLARLLADEFADWQVIVLTHDRVFATLARKLLAPWRFGEIAAWTPGGGPVLIDGNAREQLRARLAAGRAASELGGLARVALEQGISLPLEKLGLEIRYDPLGRYSANELLRALRHGLSDRKSTLAKLPVLGRMEGAGYLVNLVAHDRPADPALTTEELRHLVDDLTELEEAFICTVCSEPVWAASRDAGRHHQCGCSTLAV